MAMDMHTHEPPHTPPDPHHADLLGALTGELPLPDEVDVDLADEVHGQGDDDDTTTTRPTLPEGCEYLGEFEDLPAYFRSQLEDLVDSSVHWALDCLDYEQVQERFEADGARYFCEAGQVYRIGGQ